MSENLPYTIVKMGLLDISSYVHCGIELEDIDEVINNVTNGIDGVIASPIYSLLYYKVTTKYKVDKDVDDLMKKIISELDVLVAEKYDIKIKEQIN